MNPESRPNLAFPGIREEVFRASFRRGRFQVLAVVIMTGVGYLADTLHTYLTGATPGGLSDLLGGWAFVGFICWCVFRGGPFASGCLLIICAPLALGMLMLLGGTAFPHFRAIVATRRLASTNSTILARTGDSPFRSFPLVYGQRIRAGCC